MKLLFFRLNKSKTVIVFVFLLITLFLRLFIIDSFPKFPYTDELLMLEWFYYNNSIFSPFFFFASSSVFIYYPYFLFYELFGPSGLGLRIVSAFAGTLITYLAYKIVVKKYGYTCGFIALTVFSSGHWLIAYSRLALPNITAPLFFLLNLFFLQSINFKKRYYFLLGILNSCCFYVYTGARIIPIFTLFYLIFFLKKENYSKLFYLFFGLSIGFLPVIFFVLHPSGNFFSRESETILIGMNQVADITFIKTYLNNLIDVISVLFIKNDQSAYYFFKPLLDPISSFIILISFICIFLKNKIDNFQKYLFLCIGITLILVSLTDFPALSSRLSILIAPIYLIVSISIGKFFDFTKTYINFKYFVLLLIIIFTSNLIIYFNPRNKTIALPESYEPFYSLSLGEKYDSFAIISKSDEIENLSSATYIGLLSVLYQTKVNYVKAENINNYLLSENFSNMIIIEADHDVNNLQKLRTKINAIDRLEFELFYSKLCQDCNIGLVALGVKRK